MKRVGLPLDFHSYDVTALFFHGGRKEIWSNANLVVIYGLHQVIWWYVLASDLGLKLSSLLYLDAVKVLEDGDLQTLGMLDYDKRLSHSFTAHPKVDPFTGKTSL